MLLFKVASVKVPPATSMVLAPSPDGVNVAVYTAPDPEKELKEPPDTLISPTSKLVVDSLAVKVRVSVESLVVAPLAIEFEPLVAVIIMLGDVSS